MMSSRKTAATVLLIALMAVLYPLAGRAHETGVATVTLDIEDIDHPLMSVELDVLDLDIVVGLDDDGDGAILWADYQANAPTIARYIQSALTITQREGPCTLIPRPAAGGVRQGVAPSVLTVFELRCPAPTTSLTVINRLLSDVDPSATALLVILGEGGERSLAIKRGETTVVVAETGLIETALTYISVGLHHILAGVDHLVFLLLLLLPAARSGNLRSRSIAVAGIVTSFTIAHSITLTLSLAGYLLPPVQAVEVVIAGTVVLTALLNVVKPRHQLSWIIAYCFGLIHGFGFANALADMTVSTSLRVVNIAAFNIGVEMGQVAFVLLVFPLLCMISARAIYSRYIVTSASMVIALLGSFWMVQRLA